MALYRYAVHGRFDDVDTTRNVFYLLTASPITNHATVLGEMMNQMYAPLAAHLTDAYTIGGADVTEHDPGGEWGVSIFYPSTEVSGEGTSEPLPHQIAVCVTAYTYSKGVRGRKFLAGLCEGSQSNGLLIPSAETQFALFATKWQEGIQPPNQPAVQFVIYSESTKATNGIRSAVHRQLLATMRTRKPGRGLG